MERIAKEGRKYGVGLCVVSQRPKELSETVLAQCSSFVCLRITNPDDQAYVRGLMPEGEADLADDILEITSEWEDKAENIEPVEIGLEKTDIAVRELRLVWVRSPD